ncbi:flavohemoprotein [Actinoplanes sp. NBRC 101535]|uniref:flavohemoprotein n=1 Tax=Actinoplanes sp. NBRC 101535 TaxID=3032196 RepID=UPI002552C83D|nr:flavohemoprotein [Actinoplanes sp. NBRC 101535]
MPVSSGPASDPHLLGLLRAIRLRHNAPDAADAGETDTAAALSDLPDDDGEEHTPAGPVYGRPVPRRPVAVADEPPAETHDAGDPDPGDVVTRSAGNATSGRGDQSGSPQGHQRGRRGGMQPGGAGPGGRSSGGRRRSAERGGPDLLWRGDPGATLGRSGLDPRGGHRSPGPVPGLPTNRVNPISGVNPSSTSVPVTSIPATPGIRPLGPAGTELPSAQQGVTSGGGGAGPYPGRPGANPARTGPGPATDGMDPADDAALRDTQRLLATSLTFAGGTEDVADRLWKALHRAQPDLLAVIPGTPARQRNYLTRALTWLVHNLDSPPALVAGCGRLGGVLADCGVRWSQLQLVGAAIAEAMRAGMPPGAWRQDFDLAWRWTWQHTYEWIVHGGELSQQEPTVWTAEVIEHDRRRHDLAVLRLRPYLPLPYRPGQYARIELDEVPGVWRPYSLAGDPTRDDLLELHVRAKTETGVSGTLVHRIGVGRRVRLSRAEGHMRLPDEPGRAVLMIAGDTGVAPMKAMLAELAARGDTRPAALYWQVRHMNELYDLDDLTALALRAPAATVVPVIAEGNAGPYATGDVIDAVLAGDDWRDREVFVAGPPLMLARVATALRDRGVPAEHIHHDAPE